MQILLASLICCLTTFLHVRTVTASFYDDEPLRFATEEERSVAELERKWGVDVRYMFFFFLVSSLPSGIRYIYVLFGKTVSILLARDALSTTKADSRISQQILRLESCFVTIL